MISCVSGSCRIPHQCQTSKEDVGTNLDDVSPNDLTDPLSSYILPSPSKQRMLNVFLTQQRRHIHPRQISPQQPPHRFQILPLHLPNPRQNSRVGDFVHPRQTEHRHSSRKGREARFAEFLRVERTVIILTAGDGRRDEHSGGVDCLEYPLEMRASSHFFDEERCESLRSEFLVHAEKVDLGSLLRAATCRQPISE